MTVSVLVVDDSNMARHLVTHILQTDKSIQVLDTAPDGETALSMVQARRPDVITLDLNMPGMSGLEVTRKIMSTAPLPIIIVTSDQHSAANPFLLLEAGAVAVLRRPAPPGHPEHEQTAHQLIRTIKTLAGVKLVRRVELNKKNVPELPPATPSSLRQTRCIAIGASTGGPQVLKQIIAALPGNFPIPVLITQHMATGFVGSLVDWLKEGALVKVEMARHEQDISHGGVFIAPDNMHMGVSGENQIQLSTSAREFAMRPAVAYMFRSVAEAYGGNSAAILLTGMGRDGANELSELRKKGALTIAQDEESSLIHGMPGEAIRCGAAAEILSPEKIIARMFELAGLKPVSTTQEI